MTVDDIRARARSAANRRRLRFYQRLDGLSAYRRARIGTALARMILGALGFYYYARDYAERHHLWGPDAVWPWENFTGPSGSEGISLYMMSRSHAWFELVFHLGMLAAFLFMVGWHTRVMNAAHYVLFWSITQRNPVLLDGGDNVTVIVLAFFILIDSGGRISVDSYLSNKRQRKGKGNRKPADERSQFSFRCVSLLHNTGVVAVILQVCTVYLVSGMYKVQGERWQNGTALYYILRVNEFGWPGVNRYIYEHATLIVAITYATVFFQLAFTFLLLSRRWRLFAVSGGILMHLGIGFHMAGLITFSLTMVALELVIMDDQHYRRLAAAARGVRRRLTATEHGATQAPSTSPAGHDPAGASGAVAPQPALTAE